MKRVCSGMLVFVVVLWWGIGSAGARGLTDLGRGDPRFPRFETEPMLSFFHGVERVLELELTPSQQRKILGILTEYQGKLRDAQKSVFQARIKIRKLLAQEDTDASQIHRAFLDVAAAAEKAALLRKKMRREVLAVLTKDQKAKVLAWHGSQPVGPRRPMIGLRGRPRTVPW